MKNPVREQTSCRLCGSEKLVPIWSFGATPPANGYLQPEDGTKPELFVPLDVQWCADCHLVQLKHVVDPQVLFGNYLYVSSTSPSFVAHFAEYAAHLIQRFQLTSQDLVVDIGSNDGVLLKPLQTQGVRVLGVEPAADIASQANKEGIETVPEFLTQALAEKLVAQKGQATVISANNVFAHTNDVAEFVAAVKMLLAPQGAFVFEVQYLKDLVANNLFDIVYHEHLCYYHVAPLVRFFAEHGMEVFDVEHVPVHGGSIRVFVQHAGGPNTVAAGLAETLTAEAHLNTLKPYQEFAGRIAANKEALQKLLKDLKADGKRIVACGAPAKATTLLYAFGIDPTMLDYIVDDAPLKQGRLMPGLHIPIVSSKELYVGKPDYCLILAWNFAEPIMKTHTAFTQGGGKFIIPVPKPRIV